MKVIKFKSTAGFKNYESYFPKDSVAHPAKMNLNLLEYIIRNYTREGDMVLDPMAGTFSTCVLSALLNRHGVGVELESRFVDMGLKSKELIDKTPTLTPKGSMRVVHEDARELDKALEADSIIMSPPYSNRLSDNAVKDNDPQRMSYRQALDKLEADAIITSPPYEAQVHDASGGIRNNKLGSELPGQISMAYGYSGKADVIVTSPPYGLSVSAKHGGKDPHPERAGGSAKISEGYVETRRSYSSGVDAIISSPPYAESLSASHRSSYPREPSEITKSKNLPRPYSTYEENIGNLRGEAYFDAMRLVYAQSYGVLKPNGRMVLVIKNFIRNKRVVDLTVQTIKLCEEVGFKLEDHLLFKLPGKSFWRILYSRKYPDVDAKDLEYEHVIVFCKGLKT